MKRIRLTTEEARRVRVVAEAMVDKIICGETLRLTLPIVRLMGEIAVVKYRKIEEKYGEVV
jgi:hypothetical protein